MPTREFENRRVRRTQIQSKIKILKIAKNN
jgi:hypothetical protein